MPPPASHCGREPLVLGSPAFSKLLARSDHAGVVVRKLEASCGRWSVSRFNLCSRRDFRRARLVHFFERQNDRVHIVGALVNKRSFSAAIGWQQLDQVEARRGVDARGNRLRRDDRGCRCRCERWLRGSAMVRLRLSGWLTGSRRVDQKSECAPDRRFARRMIAGLQGHPKKLLDAASMSRRTQVSGCLASPCGFPISGEPGAQQRRRCAR